MTKKVFLGLALMLILLVPTTVLSAHAASAPPAPGDSDKYNYNAGGSTFAYPIVDKWRVQYHALYPGITLNYQAIGSGAGIKLFTSKKVDFAGTDAPLQKSEIAKAPKGTLTIPESMGAIVVTYNVPGIYKNGLKLTGDVIAKIFMGQITKWNDPSLIKLQTDSSIIKALQNDRNKINVVHRSDGSGTTFAFSSYLSQVSSAWNGKIGHATSVPWPTGMGGSGNAGVAAIVKKVPESIGYVELAYAKQNTMNTLTGNAGVGLGAIPMTYAYVQNHDKTAFLDATVATTAAAASGAVSSLPAADGVWSNVSINDAPGPNAYPIATFTYLLVNPNLEQLSGMSQQKAQDLVHMLYWFVTDGQQYATKLLYVPLPSTIQELDEKGISEIKFNGQQLWSYP
ncbi:MAG: phosphate ABC transporter substrate-binding protein PstS [Thaumarchaeota archaeon]|nr:phosphate ABC transporter substrate-binding protein PstS [Nitrososphaerota archaeon]